MKEGYSRGLIGIAVLLMTQLSCRPVVAIGWQELAILLVIAALVVGPLLFRLYRLLARFQEFRDTEGEKRSKRSNGR